MLPRIEQMIEKSESFAFEKTLSGFTYLNIIKKAKERGYEITLLFVYLSSVPLAVERVAIRVGNGGHSIPVDVIQRRYEKGIKNFARYSIEADDWYIYNNSGNEYEIVASYADGAKEIINFEVFKIFESNE